MKRELIKIFYTIYNNAKLNLKWLFILFVVVALTYFSFKWINSSFINSGKKTYFFPIIFSILFFITAIKIISNNNKGVNDSYKNRKKEFFNFIIFLPTEIISFISAIAIILYWKQIKSFINLEINIGKELLNNNTVIEAIFHFIFSYIFVFLFIIGLIYWKAILNSIKEFWNKDLILKVVTREFLDDVLNAESKISYNLGIKGIINGLPGQGVSLKTTHFVKLLGISASLKPQIVYGCWNTVWYPLHKIFEIKANEILIKEEWKAYFDNLDEVYKESDFITSEHKRIFIVENPNLILNILDDIKNNRISKITNKHFYWVYLLNKHFNEWNIKDIFFISKDELEEQINDEINTNIPNWRDFAIFIKKYYCLLGFCIRKKIWGFAQENEPQAGNSIVIYKTGKTVEEVIDFFFNDNNRWKTKVHLQFDENKMINVII